MDFSEGESEEEYLDEEQAFEDEDDDDNGMQYKDIPNKGVDYEITERRELLEKIKRTIGEIKDTFAVPDDVALALLVHFHWSKEKLIEEWFGNSELVCKRTGLPTAPMQGSNKKSKSYSHEIDCSICMETRNADSIFALSCSHYFCLDCWSQYFKRFSFPLNFSSALSMCIGCLEVGQHCLTSKCPTPKCNIICTSSVFKKFLPQEAFHTYERLVLENYVSSTPNCKWCPSPGCTYAIKTVGERYKPVDCKCGFRYCFKCSDFEVGDHAPAACEMVEMWLKKSADESENVTWLRANTKSCPKCRSHIEKNGGCMHMTCRKCNHEFCWICRKDWKGHRDCNRNETVEAEEKEANDAKNELEKYMFFYHRYESHRNAMKIADTQRQQADNLMNELMTTYSIGVQDAKFVSAATEQLLQNRNMLQYSYVYAYYMANKWWLEAEKSLFEYLQAELEHHTDKLSELYEKGLELEDFWKWKERITNYTSTCHRFLKNFVEGVIDKTLVHPEGMNMSDEERYFIVQIEELEAMGIKDRSLTVPMLTKHNGDIQKVVAELFY